MSYYSMVYYTGNGSLVNFTIPFPYLAQSHVKVYVQGLLKTLTTHYTFSTSSVITFNTAPLAGEIVTIKRSSGRDTRLVDFQTGSILDEATLDQDSNQLFYLMQESFDSLTLAGNEDGAVFVTPASILNAITGQVDVEHLVASLNSPIGYWSQIHKHDAIYEFNEDGTSVYDHGVMGDEEARITLAESRITVNEDNITLLVSDTEGNAAAIAINSTDIGLNVTSIEGHTSQLALMADEFYVKLDGNGNVTGFGLYNGETSAFVVNADTFAVVKSDGTGDTITPFVVDGVSGLVAIAGNLLVGGSITGAKVAANTIEASNIAAATITAAEITLATITNALLVDGTIQGTKITGNAIDTPHLATDCVEAAQIKAGVVDTTHLAALSISTAKIQVGAVDGTLIAEGIVDTVHLAADSITTAKINALAVTATEIASDAVTAAKIVAGTITVTEIYNLAHINGNRLNIYASGSTTVDGNAQMTITHNLGRYAIPAAWKNATANITGYIVSNTANAFTFEFRYLSTNLRIPSGTTVYYSYI